MCIRDRAENVVFVPSDAVFTHGDRKVVYVNHDGRIRGKEIIAGLTNETHVEVRAGLDADSELLLETPGRSVPIDPLPEPDA